MKLAKYGIDAALAAVMVTVGLWEEADGGYTVHDFHDHNPTAAAVKDKRKRDRERKRRAYGLVQDSAPSPRGESVGESDGVSEDSASSSFHAHAGAPTDRDGTGKERISGEPERVARPSGRTWDGPIRRHPLEEAPGKATDPESCARADAFLVRFAAWHQELAGSRFVVKQERDWDNALRLVHGYRDAELVAIARLYMVATGKEFDRKPKSPGHLLYVASMLERRLREEGQWPTAA